jgi:hypothetical protein
VKKKRENISMFRRFYLSHPNTKVFIHSSSVPGEYQHSNCKKQSPFKWAPNHKIAICSKMARTISIKFQPFMETISLNKTAWVTSVGRCRYMHKGPKYEMSILWKPTLPARRIVSLFTTNIGGPNISRCGFLDNVVIVNRVWESLCNLFAPIFHISFIIYLITLSVTGTG